MRDQLHIGSRLSWVVAWVLAVTGSALVLLWRGDGIWWVGVALLIPLVGLVMWREDKKGYADGGYGPGDNGPWFPPG